MLDHLFEPISEISGYGRGVATDMGAFFRHQFKFQLDIIYFSQHTGLVRQLPEDHFLGNTIDGKETSNAIHRFCIVKMGW